MCCSEGKPSTQDTEMRELEKELAGPTQYPHVWGAPSASWNVWVTHQGCGWIPAPCPHPRSGEDRSRAPTRVVELEKLRRKTGGVSPKWNPLGRGCKWSLKKSKGTTEAQTPDFKWAQTQEAQPRVYCPSVCEVMYIYTSKEVQPTGSNDLGVHSWGPSCVRLF